MQALEDAKGGSEVSARAALQKMLDDAIAQDPPRVRKAEEERRRLEALEEARRLAEEARRLAEEEAALEAQRLQRKLLIAARKERIKERKRLARGDTPPVPPPAAKGRPRKIVLYAFGGGF